MFLSLPVVTGLSFSGRAGCLNSHSLGTTAHMQMQCSMLSFLFSLESRSWWFREQTAKLLHCSEHVRDNISLFSSWLRSLSYRFGLSDLRFWWGSPRPRSTSAGPTVAPCAPSVCVTGKRSISSFPDPCWETGMMLVFAFKTETKTVVQDLNWKLRKGNNIELFKSWMMLLQVLNG